MDSCLRGLFTDDCFLKEELSTPLVRPPRRASTQSWLPRLKKYLPKSWMTAAPAPTKAVKSDDAGISTHLWNQRILLVLPWVAPFLFFLRGHLMLIILRNLYVEFKEFMNKEHGKDWSTKLTRSRKLGRQERRQGGHGRKEVIQNKNNKISRSENSELLRDAEVGVSVLRNFGEADWWTWKGGSTLIFWRWPEGCQRKAARDGMTPWITGELPNFKRKAKPLPPEERKSIWSKVDKFLRRGYVRRTRQVRSYTEYFSVPKGDDIRVVFNGTSCKLNQASWAPNFWLPTSRSATRVLDFDYKTVDIDLGEMFLNFPLHETFQEYSGIDLTPFSPEINEMKSKTDEDTAHVSDARTSGRWERC
jgi:hypothetical protein